MSEENFVISQTKLFVGGLNWKMRGRELNESFSQFGEVIFARVKLGEDGRSKGFGFVEFKNAEDAAKAKEAMDEQELMGRTVKVDFAKEDPERLKAREEAAAAAAAAATEENTEEKTEE
ncbi:RNA-binding protein [Candidatus Gracilibacteria bacterium]|nr:RNA-binding protein [Candidatus Gracilibacteria bacterium]